MPCAVVGSRPLMLLSTRRNRRRMSSTGSLVYPPTWRLPRPLRLPHRRSLSAAPLPSRIRPSRALLRRRTGMHRPVLHPLALPPLNQRMVGRTLSPASK